MGCFITGLLISGLTPWGFFKHRWVAVKWILTIFCIVFGIVVLGPTVNDQPQYSAKEGLLALNNPEYLSNYINSILGGIFQMLALIFMVTISVIKPWRKSLPS
jgi:hypothetical protein